MQVAFPVADIINRLPLKDGGRPNIQVSSLPEAIAALPIAADVLKKTGQKDLLFADLEDLTVEQFRETIAEICSFVKTCADKLPPLKFKQDLILRYATVHNVILTLTDRQTLLEMAHTQRPVRMPNNLNDVYTRPDHLVRTGHPFDGHPFHDKHRELPVSAELYGSQLVSYFIVSGQSFPNNDLDAVITSLVAHDSDEFIFFLGMANGEPVEGLLPIYSESETDPYQFVRNPIRLKAGEAGLYDGKAPHYWFAPRDSIAFFVSASRGGLFRKPVAFGWQHRDSSPGGAYLLFEPNNGYEPGRALTNKQLDKTRNLMGKRLRKRRDAYQLSANDVQYRKRGRPIRANIIGKIENAALDALTLRSVADYAYAMDLTLGELFVRDQPVRSLQEFTSHSSAPVSPLYDKTQQRGTFAVAPYIIRPSRKERSADERLQFWEGDADVVLLPLSGRVTVHVIPDPLLLALELGASDFNREGNGDSSPFSLKREAMDNLRIKQLLLTQVVEERNAYHFNTALPHAVEATDTFEAGTDGSKDRTLVVTTRNDRHLPDCWLGSSPRHKTIGSDDK